MPTRIDIRNAVSEFGCVECPSCAIVMLHCACHLPGGLRTATKTFFREPLVAANLRALSGYDRDSFPNSGLLTCKVAVCIPIG